MSTHTEPSLEHLDITLSGKTVRLALERHGPNNAELWLLLPALSTVSSRSEWRPFAAAIGSRYQLLSFDWPGFGDSDMAKVSNHFTKNCSLSGHIKYKF